MSQIYSHISISKQAFHQYRLRAYSKLLIEQETLLMVKDIREDHPGMGARTIYSKLGQCPVGRDRFEQLLLDTFQKHDLSVDSIRCFALPS